MVDLHSEDILFHLDHPAARRYARNAENYFAEDQQPDLYRHIATGESRRVYLINKVVYKCGRVGANEYEDHWLRVWREAGAHWAPPTTLWTTTIPAPHCDNGETITEPVLAMPYYPDNDDDNPDDLAAIRAAAPSHRTGPTHERHRQRQRQRRSGAADRPR